MRLLEVNTLTLCRFDDIKKIPPYAILSHTWSDEEVTFELMQQRRHANLKKMKGYEKILSASRQAATDGFEYIWIDTCCIDKSSSAELSEAINSMFKWYEQAGQCYAYLEDVTWR